MEGISAVTAEREHHSSKRNVYTVLLVPNEEAAHAKNFRFALWQVALGLAVGALVLVGSVLALVVYTPAGAMLPIKNPQLENRYNKELVSINQRMAGLMEQLVELRSYNVKLRQVLGENVTTPDSTNPGKKVLSRASEPEPNQPVAATSPSGSGTANEGYSLQLMSNASDSRTAGISFPAILPTQGFISRGYEPEKAHFGLDIAGKTGISVLAAADGHVIFSGWTHDDGNIVIVSHENGFLTFYKHNQSLLRSTSTFVKRGEPIALLGNTGRTSSGPHVHFEIWKDGTPVDPTRYILNLNL